MQILAGYGVQLDRSTLARWMKQAAWMLKALYRNRCGDPTSQFFG
jgi:hypothetical protein